MDGTNGDVRLTNAWLFLHSFPGLEYGKAAKRGFLGVDRYKLINNPGLQVHSFSLLAPFLYILVF